MIILGANSRKGFPTYETHLSNTAFEFGNPDPRVWTGGQAYPPAYRFSSVKVDVRGDEVKIRSSEDNKIAMYSDEGCRVMLPSAAMSLKQPQRCFGLGNLLD